jgi:hypothetical protein
MGKYKDAGITTVSELISALEKELDEHGDVGIWIGVEFFDVVGDNEYYETHCVYRGGPLRLTGSTHSEHDLMDNPPRFVKDELYGVDMEFISLSVLEDG